ncbi:helix-turn-helix transcriptional regulator [Planosporangium flavigriseum]|uniref:Transcriptional regulator n=1 Tax=Planosporangium flavigriseum TaxID=373681 RepID=A0A8J3LK42_9ACTN|nr:helix-turn-helix transcriptional regulator [Planosporangium flavigriseum]NJC64395.1 helix-turn-helix transcriptional regulator [Planosporangium flavigriseum]GIG72133.1 transcriptional regulator [Planosporangium flavigriseum]
MADGSTVKRRRLGMRLRELRDAAGKTRDEAAAYMEVTAQTISRFELGRGGIRAKTVRELLDFYGVKPDDPIRADLEQMAREGRTRGWWSAYASVIDSGYATFIGFEDSAVEVLTHGALVVPGLLQTENYARSVIHSGRPDLPAAQVDRRVEVRMERQGRLAEGLRFWAILDEAVIRRVVGGPAVMRAQLERLVEAARLPNVTVQVLPFAAGGHAGMLGAFTILSFASDPEVVYVEGATADQFLEGDSARPYTLHFNGLRAAGLHPDESIRLIEEAARVLR